MSIRSTLLLLAPLVTQAAPAQDLNVSGGALQPDQACYDVQHYDLSVRVHPDEHRIEGLLRMTAEWVGGAGTMALDLDHALEVTEIQLNDGTREHVHEGGRITVSAEGLEKGATFELAVAYQGTPREAPRPPWKGGFTWSQTRDGSPWIATTCQGEGADLWWPCKDHPSDKPESMDLRVTVPDPLIVASNGKLKGVIVEEDGWSTHHWHVSTPIANYTVALNIAPYKTITTEFESVAGDTFEFTFWVLAESYEKGITLFPELQEHVAHMESICGPYPFRADKYGVVETPHLGMEHQSIIAYGNQFRGDPLFDYDWLHHHELAHEWWANLVTCSDWKDFWIHEGIGTYVQALYLERKFGAEAYHKKMAVDLRRVLNRGAIAPREDRNTQQMYFAQAGSDAPGIDIYMKGSWVCHTLRWYLGDETFFRVLRRWAYPDPAMERVSDGSHIRFETTDGLLALAEEHSGAELGWLFEVYLRRAELPELQQRMADGVLHLKWKTPDELPFHLDVPVRIGDEVLRVNMQDGSGELEVGKARYEVDPDHWLLRKR